MPTIEELQAENAALRARLDALPPNPLATPTGPFIAEQPGNPTLMPRKTWQLPQPSQQLLSTKAWLANRRGKAAPEDLVGQISQIKTVITSGVNSAGYGDKRTEFRSLSELNEILNGLEEELAGLLGIGGRIRQIRMTTQADKGL